VRNGLLDDATRSSGHSSSVSFDADVVLVDIEGTISPLSFVRDVLFPYSRKRLAEFVANHRSDPAIKKILEEARALAGGGDPVQALKEWQDQDVKAPPLKKLQGMIWGEGYRSGALRSSLFPDALVALRRWKAAGLRLYVYSSGSVEAQLLFFEFSTAGDLRSLLSGYFDTDVGAKVDSASYACIAEQIGASRNSIIFFSDSFRELDAARVAGLQTVLVAREKAPSGSAFPVISTFCGVDVLRR
jgi:enolase-phosphatase E1